MNRLKNEKGATMVEMTFASLAFFTIIFTAMDVFLVGYYNMVTQHVASEALRKITVNSEWSSSQARDEVLAHGSSYGLSLSPEDVKICAGGFDSCNTESRGVSGQLIVVSVDKQLQSITRGWDYSVKTSIIGRNEPA